MLSWLSYPSPALASDRLLLLMLPPAGAQAAEFAGRGLVADAQASGLPIDIVTVQPDIALYLDEDGIAAELHRQIVAPALAQGYRRIWLLGISLGGMGALLYTAAHYAVVEGVILLAPFLGTKGTIAALAKAGGLAAEPAQTGIATAQEEKLLAWLRNYAASGQRAPALYLGFGTQDRFSPGHRMLAALLPPHRVVALQGGHDWPCWRALFRQLLATAPFGA